MTYSSEGNRHLVPVVLAFATNKVFERMALPNHAVEYDLGDGYAPIKSRLKTHVLRTRKEMWQTPAGRMERRGREALKKLRARQQLEYDTQSNIQADRVVNALIQQWPETTQPTCDPGSSTWFDVEKTERAASNYFKSCKRNNALRVHITQVEASLGRGRSTPVYNHTNDGIPPFTVPHGGLGRSRGLSSPTPNRKTLLQMLANPPKLAPAFRASCDGDARPKHTLPGKESLRKLIQQALTSNISLMRRIGGDLDESLRDLENRAPQIYAGDLPSLDNLNARRTACHEELNSCLQAISNSLAPQNPADRALQCSGLWPQITSRFLLELLSLQQRTGLSEPWLKECLTFTRAFMEYQSSQRLYKYALLGQGVNFFKEVDGALHGIGSDDVDWALVQVNLSTNLLTPCCSDFRRLTMISGQGQLSSESPNK